MKGLQSLALQHRNLKLTAEQIQSLSDNLYKNSDLHINAPIELPGTKAYSAFLKDGKFKNQFQLAADATSEGHLDPTKKGSRDEWELNFSNGLFSENQDYKKIKTDAYFPKSVADERPIYGYVSDTKASRGPRLNGRYGEVTFKLKENVRDRATIFYTNTSAFSKEIDNIESLRNNAKSIELLLTNTKNVTNEELLMMIDQVIAPAGFTRSSYTEMQIYGGVNIADDVETIIVSRDLPHIKALADKWKVGYEVHNSD